MEVLTDIDISGSMVLSTEEQCGDGDELVKTSDKWYESKLVEARVSYIHRLLRERRGDMFP